MLLAGGLALVALAIALRLLPWSQGVLGVDAWFYRAHADALRRQRALPTRLPQYLLAREEQEYPPLFPVLLALLPDAALGKSQPWIAAGIDALQLILLLVTAHVMGLGLVGTLVSGLAYATTPDLAHEYGTLSSRPLASLLLTLAVLTTSSSGAAAFAGCVVLVALLFLTHKLAVQFLLVLLPSLAIAEGTARPVMAGVLGLGVALLASRGFYVRVFHSHLEILRYWRQHVSFRGAHPVYDSPLYAGAAPPTWRSTRLYAPGLSRRFRLIRTLVARNPWGILAVPVAIVGPTPGRIVLVWAAIAYMVAIGTLFLPPLRFLGEGYRYLKFAAFPVALIVGTSSTTQRWPLVTFFFVLSLYVTSRLLAVRPLEVMDSDFGAALAFLQQDPRERIAVLPTHRADAIAWLAQKKVLWGGHSSGYVAFGDLVPVLRRSLRDQLEEYAIDLLLLDRQYVEPECLALGGNWSRAWEGDRHVVFERTATTS